MKNFIVGGAALLILSACASSPDPASEVVQKPDQTAQAPAPQIFEPVQEAAPPPITQTAPQNLGAIPDPNLPIPGSAEDFAYQLSLIHI